MADEAQIIAAVTDCLAAIAFTTDPKATIDEFCATLTAKGTWTVVELTIVQLRVRRALYAPD